MCPIFHIQGQKFYFTGIKGTLKIILEMPYPTLIQVSKNCRSDEMNLLVIVCDFVYIYGKIYIYFYIELSMSTLAPRSDIAPVRIQIVVNNATANRNRSRSSYHYSHPRDHTATMHCRNYDINTIRRQIHP